jgi:glutamate-1-semialdehyde 2,1-aminomutase
MAILKTFGPGRLLWGSDFPVSHQRGKCVTVGDAFSWICPERIDLDPAAPPCHATLVGLESFRALITAGRLLDLTPEDLDRIFFRNAVELLGMEAAEDRGAG